MPFREKSAVETRIAMFQEYETGAYSVVDLCARYEISRATFYAWRQRREVGGERWYEELPRAPHVCPHATPDEIVRAVVAMRHRFPRFGPKKILGRLASDRPSIGWPATSTIGDILKREGLIEVRRRRRRPIAQGERNAGADQPNDEWAIDFKGWFRTRDGERCDPLTLTDTASRYLLAAKIMQPTGACVKAALEKTFREFGLPQAIRSDNGSPFGSTGAGGLSRLSVWLLKIGIEPRYIPPSSPQDNGRHERMHRTMKEETTRPPAATRSEQQRRFDRFRRHYNEERPHEALGQTLPAEHWRPSTRRFPCKLEDPWYDADHEVRRVAHTGAIKWRSAWVFVGEALAGQLVGIAELENGNRIVRFMGHDLGVIDRALRFHRFAPPRVRLRSAMETEPGTE